MLYIRDLKNNRIPARSFFVAGLLIFLIFVEIDKKITIKDSEKRLMESLKSIQINCNTLRQ